MYFQCSTYCGYKMWEDNIAERLLMVRVRYIHTRYNCHEWQKQNQTKFGREHVFLCAHAFTITFTALQQATTNTNMIIGWYEVNLMYIFIVLPYHKFYLICVLNGIGLSKSELSHCCCFWASYNANYKHQRYCNTIQAILTILGLKCL